MNSRALRRLAADHGALHHQALPPNYLFPTAASTDDLTQLDLLLTGPSHTPFAAGVWRLHLSIPPTYPQQPPVANFRTPIFHPNVDPQTGGVCVETLKRDWDSKLTLRDVLVTISCLLIQPNPDSALNAEAGALIQEDYEAFARRATLMTSIHAAVPKALQIAAREAQNRGQEEQMHVDEQDGEERDAVVEAPVRRRRTIAKVRSNMRRSEESPSGGPPQRRQPQNHPFVFVSGNDDVFGISTPQSPAAMAQLDEDDDGISEGEQENDLSKPPAKATTPAPTMTPRRPHGVPVPLGELILDQGDQDTSEEMEPEYPPSPSKSSPLKRSPKRRQMRNHDSDVNMERPESSRDAAMRSGFNTTPPNITDQPLFDESQLMDITFERSVSPRKTRRGLFGTPPKRPGKGGLFGDFGDVISSTPEVRLGRGILKPRSPSSAERRREEEQKSAALDAKLWDLCGGDIQRWNRGDFDGEPFKKKASRW